MVAILITGAPGSGKTTIVGALARKLPRAAHIQVDFFRKMVKGGYASPHEWSDEVARQYQLARSNAVRTAVAFAQAGFIPIIDDIIPADWVQEWIDSLPGLEPKFVILNLPLEVGLERNQERETWTVDEKVLADLHGMLQGEYTSDWIAVDSGLANPEDAADIILDRTGL